MSKLSRWRQRISNGLKNLTGSKKSADGGDFKPEFAAPEILFDENNELLTRLRALLLSPKEPNAHLNPKCLATKLKISEFEMLGALSYALRDGLIELHWEIFCPVCGARSAELSSLREAHSQMDCPSCGNIFETHLDRDVRVTFLASELLREGGNFTPVLEPPENDQYAPTSGLDLLLVPSFRKLFSNEAPALDESLRIGRVAILFTDLRGSMSIYAE